MTTSKSTEQEYGVRVRSKRTEQEYGAHTPYAGNKLTSSSNTYDISETGYSTDLPHTSNNLISPDQFNLEVSVSLEI